MPGNIAAIPSLPPPQAVSNIYSARFAVKRSAPRLVVENVIHPQLCMKTGQIRKLCTEVGTPQLKR